MKRITNLQKEIEQLAEIVSKFKEQKENLLISYHINASNETESLGSSQLWFQSYNSSYLFNSGLILYLDEIDKFISYYYKNLLFTMKEMHGEDIHGEDIHNKFVEELKKYVMEL